MSKSENVNENETKNTNVKTANFGNKQGLYAVQTERTLDEDDFENMAFQAPSGEDVLVLTQSQMSKPSRRGLGFRFLQWFGISASLAWLFAAGVYVDKSVGCAL